MSLDGTAPPTMLPGHGSTFSHRHRPRLSFPYATTAITSHQVSQKGEITQVVFDHLHVSYSLRLPSNSVSSGTNKGNPNPPIPQESIQKTQKHRRHCQVALRHFLAMLAMIRCDYAPTFDGAHPQGVQWDSLEGFVTVAAGEPVDTPVLCAFFCACSIGYYILCVLAPLYT